LIKPVKLGMLSALQPNREMPMPKLIPMFVVAAAILVFSPLKAADEPALVENMGAMQYFLHKLSLSVAARNAELADFYAHELEETIEAAEDIKEYKGKPIGQLVKGMLVPSFEALEDGIDSDDWQLAGNRLSEVINACNACHQATGFGYLQIAPTTQNPFMQSFEPVTP
jgi:hypothetical protein